MKKMLVLMLVFGIATAANAGLLTLSADGSDIEINGSGYTVAGAGITSFLVYTDTLAVDGLTMEYLGVGATITTPAITFAQFEGAMGLSAGSVTAARQINISDSSMTYVPNGLLVSGSTTGAGTVYLLDQAAGPIGSVVIVPEPATVVLLSLGGLLLRRKK